MKPLQIRATLLTLLMAAALAVAQSNLYPVGKVLTPVPGQKGCYVVKLVEGVQVRVGDTFWVEGLTPDLIQLEVTALEADSATVRTRDHRVFLSAGTAVGSKDALTVSSASGSGTTGGVRASKSAAQEQGPDASRESVLAQERSRLKNTSLRERYDEPVVTNGPVSASEVYSRPQYAQNDVATPLSDFNNEQAPMARETTDGLPGYSRASNYNQAGTSGAAAFEKGGLGSFDANLPATFVVEKSYFFLDNQQNICVRLKVRNKGGKPARFMASCDCVSGGGRVVYSITKEMPQLEPGEYNYFNVVTGLKPRRQMLGTGYMNASSVMTRIETEQFGEVRARPQARPVAEP